jgi:hypothetical protein
MADDPEDLGLPYSGFVLIDPDGEPYSASPGALDATKVIDPDAASASLAQILRGILYTVSLVPTSLPPTLPEKIGGTNAVLAVKVSQTGAGTVTIEALDADEAWDVLGWRLSFTAACTLTIAVDDDDAALSYVWDVPSAGIDSEPIRDYALMTGNVGEPLTFANSAGNMKGIVWVRKHS